MTTKHSKTDRSEIAAVNSAAPIVENLQVWELGYDLSHQAFNKPAIQKRIRELLPTKSRRKIQFLIKNTNPAVANAIRRIGISELKVKCMWFDIQNIKTNDKEIILSELQDRVSQISLDQNISLDTVFSFTVMNDSAAEEYKVGYAKNLIQVSGPVLSERPFADNYRLCELRPGKILEIPAIYIIEGYSYDTHGSCFSLTAEFKYQVRDYIGIDFLNERGNIVNKMVSSAELLSLMKSLKISTAEITETINSPQIIRPLILIIPDPNYMKMLDGRARNRVQRYTTIIEGTPSKVDAPPLEVANSFLREYSSEEVCPTEFFLEFTLHDNIAPVAFLQNICDNMIERLQRLADPASLVVQQDDKKTQIMIKGEDHTIGQALRRTIYLLDPGIGLVNMTIEHPQIRTCTINIRHPNPLKIFQDARATLVRQFESLKAQFAQPHVHKEPLYLK
jgi:DNA-directed RNA polymerase subunit L